jgi:tRNA modification GTPase
MVVVFPQGRSYTGEAMAEIHCHGGRAVLADLLDAIGAQPDCRLARAGEFTYRAFLAGRMDLSEVEGLGDLIAAETSEQRRQALRVHSGAVSRKTEAWRALLLQARSLVELTIDWADEEVSEDVNGDVNGILKRLFGEMQEELSRGAPAERMRTGFEVAIIGPPNVGKSSLLNAIAGREAAIVSEVAGTTRDVIEVRFDLNGIPVIFLDTAGLREALDPVEGIGVARAIRRAESADLRLVLASSDTADAAPILISKEDDLRVWAKGDLGGGAGDLVISALRNQGIDRLLGMVHARLARMAAGAGVLAHARQKAAVESALLHMERALTLLSTRQAEVTAEELRLASAALDRVTGRISPEDILGQVFSSFCLGK